MSDTPATHLDDAVAELALVARDGTATTAAFENAVRGVWQAAARTTTGAASQAFRTLVLLLSLTSEVRAGFVALACGGLVERGADPDAALAPVLARLGALLDNAAAFASAASAAAERDGRAGLEPADAAVQFGSQVAQQNPPQAWAWNALNLFGRAAIAMLGRSKAGRQAARRDIKLTVGLAHLASAHPAADWLTQLLGILDDEPLLVLHPAYERGYRVIISGIADNFQLHTLLADALVGDPAAGWLPGERPAADIVAGARGELGAPDDLIAQGVFNLVGWRGISGAGNLAATPKASTEHWIMGEGAPAEIDKFEGLRVVLLTDAPYKRTWNAAARFPGLAAEVRVVDQLPATEVNDWLRRLADAAHARPDTSV